MRKISYFKTASLIALFSATGLAAEDAAPARRGGWGSLITGSADAAIVANVEAARARLNTEGEGGNDVTLTAGTSGMSAAISASNTPFPIEGTWVATVVGPPVPFRALQTYHRDRNYMDTTDILATLAESPGQGVYKRVGGDFIVTFELFAFAGVEPVGIIRVTNLLHIGAGDVLTGESLVDFIDNDGNVQENVGSGSFTARRITPLPFE